MLSNLAFGQGRDTILAVHHLFKQKRRSGLGWVAAGADVAVDESVGWRATGTPTDKALSAAVLGGVPFTIGLLQAQRFSAMREAWLLQQYAQGMPIPLDIRRRLRRKHFRRTARDLAQGW